MIGWRVFWWADTVAALLVLLSGNFLLGERRTKPEITVANRFLTSLFHLLLFFITSSYLLYINPYGRQKTRGQALRCKATQSLPLWLLRKTHTWTYFAMLRRFLNLSTRPPASTNFCLPVKNGWHFEQISTRISPLVDFVLITSPHAQLMVHSLYSGWSPSFIFYTSSHRYSHYKIWYHRISKKASLFLK